MSTTTLFVDLLIIGIQVAIWLSLLVLSLFGFDWIDLAQVKGWETTIAIVLLPIIYPLGIFIDEFADWLLSGWNDRIKKQYRSDPSRSVMSLLMKANDAKLAEFFHYIRIRIRLSRSTALNACITALIVPLFVARQLGDVPAGQKWFIAGLVCSGCAAMCLAALAVWRRLSHSFYKKCAAALDELAKKQTARIGTPFPAYEEPLQASEPESLSGKLGGAGIPSAQGNLFP